MAKNSVSQKRSLVTKVLKLALFIVPVVGLAVFGGYYYQKYQDLNKMTSDQFAQRDNNRIISEVKKLYSLPSDEQPQIATIKDKEAVKKQYPFFDQAENNDVILIYAKAKLAIQYRPATKQLIKVGPVNTQSVASIRVVGSEAERAKVEKTLSDNKVQAADGGNAKSSYSGTTIVNLSGKYADSAKELAALLGGKVGNLPAGEDKPADVDILVIVGPTTTAQPTPGGVQP